MQQFQKQVSLKDHTTLHVGGPAAHFVTVESEAELCGAVVQAEKACMPFRVIGGGSNILVPDTGLSGLTIKNAIPGIEEKRDDNTVTLTVGAGVVFDEFVAHCVRNEFWGLENLSYIPGTVGATPVQNVGAYGVEIGDYIKEVRVLNTQTHTFETLSNDDCKFSYRDSIFKKPEGKKFIVCSVTLELSIEPKPKLEYRDLADTFGKGAAPAIQEIRDAVIAIRSRKFPDWNIIGTAGSFFKNPIVHRAVYEKLHSEYPELPGFEVSEEEVKIPLGWILDKVCGLRGVSEGSVGTYEGQALVIVNKGGATAAEIVAFAESIARKVFEVTKITIEWEVTRLE